MTAQSPEEALKGKRPTKEMALSYREFIAADPVSLLKKFNPPCLLPRQRRTLWTNPYMVQPALVSKAFGAGDLLITLSPIMHRPAYYLVLVDQTIFDNMGDHIDDITTAIEDEFGFRGSDDVDFYRWPLADFDGGCAWSKATAESVMTYRAYRARLPASRLKATRRA